MTPIGSRGLRVAMLSLHTSPLAQPGSGDSGGMNVYVRSLAEALAARGAVVDVFTRSDSPLPPTPLAPGATVHHVPAGPPGPVSKERLPRYLPHLASRILADAEGGYDVVHSHYWMSGIAGLRLADAWGAPLVHTMHTMGRVKKHHHADAEEPDIRLDAEALLVRRAARLTANTPAETRELVHHYAADPERVDLVPPGVDLQVFSPRGAARWTGGPMSAAEAHAARRPLRILFAGRIQKLKGPQVLVRALGLLRTRRPDLRLDLVVVGARSGSRELDLHRLALEAGVADSVSFVPPEPAPRLAEWFRGADVVAVPSYSESFGLVAMEAQACGTPVLAHDVGGLRHTVLDGITGRLVADLEPGRWAQVLEGVAAGPRQLASWAAPAAAHAAGFSWDRTAAAALDSYSAAQASVLPAPAVAHA